MCSIPKESRTEKNPDYKPDVIPFDGRLILNVCYRMVTRKGHLTFLDQDLSHKLFTALSYIASYIGVDDIESEKQNDADYFAFFPI